MSTISNAERATERASSQGKAPMVELRGVYKVYAMGDVDVAALDGIDLRIARGEFVSITGPSGSGKSTLLHLLGCLDTPTQGTYLLEGHDVTHLPDRELSRIRNRHFGFVFQSYNLMPELTAVENVEQPLLYARVPRRERRDRAVALLNRVDLTDRAHHLPRQLSGGQQQRVAIARALINEPTLLLADEPTGNLNTEAGEQVLKLLTELHDQGLSIAMVTHDPAVAAFSKRRIHILDGLIASDGPPAAAPANN